MSSGVQNKKKEAPLLCSAAWTYGAGGKPLTNEKQLQCHLPELPHSAVSRSSAAPPPRSRCTHPKDGSMSWHEPSCIGLLFQAYLRPTVLVSFSSRTYAVALTDALLYYFTAVVCDAMMKFSSRRQLAYRGLELQLCRCANTEHRSALVGPSSF
jgi:hypothetical protein